MWPVGYREQETLSKNEIAGVGVGVREDEMEIHLVKGQKRVPEGGKGVTLKERRMGAVVSETKKEERNIKRGEESIRGGFGRKGCRERVKQSVKV
jgi:hypothetical protein